MSETSPRPIDSASPPALHLVEGSSTAPAADSPQATSWAILFGSLANAGALAEFLPRQYRELGFGGVGSLGGHRGSGNPFGVTRRDVDWAEDDPVEIVKRELLDNYDLALALVNAPGGFGV